MHCVWARINGRALWHIHDNHCSRTTALSDAHLHRPLHSLGVEIAISTEANRRAINVTAACAVNSSRLNPFRAERVTLACPRRCPRL